MIFRRELLFYYFVIFLNFLPIRVTHKSTEPATHIYQSKLPHSKHQPVHWTGRNTVYKMTGKGCKKKKQKSSSSEAPHDSYMIALFISKSVSPNLISGNNVLNPAPISFKLDCLDLFLSLLLVSDFLCYCLLPSPHLYNSLSLLYILIIRVTYTAFSITHSGILS